MVVVELGLSVSLPLLSLDKVKSVYPHGGRGPCDGQTGRNTQTVSFITTYKSDSDMSGRVNKKRVGLFFLGVYFVS